MNIKLKEAIENDDLVLFIGAGMSIPLKFPNWKELIINILKKLEEPSAFNFSHHIAQGDSIDVFDVLNRLEAEGYKSKTKTALNKEIVDVVFKTKNLDKHKKLWDISNKIITTNYDKVIEHVTPGNVKVFSNNNTFQQAESLNGSPFLYKIHGDIDNPDTCILFTSDYKELYEYDNPNKKTLEYFLKSKTILFLGFSLEDPFITNQIEYLHKIYNGYGKEHFIVLNQYKDFKKYNVSTIQIDDWNGSYDKFLDELGTIKKNYNVKKESDTENVDISMLEDLVLLQSMYREKVEDLKKEDGLKKKESYKDLYKIKNRIIEIQTKELDFELHIPAHEELEIQEIFDAVFTSEKLTKQLISKINEVKNQHSEKYNWYHRSVIVSGLACSLINHKKVDPQKIDLLIDFTNDSEKEVWEKAITYLFLVLNHLGNKWLRYDNLKPKLERLKNHTKIQESLKNIIALMQFGLQDVSPLGEEIFKNDYFKENPFNYFLPFYKGNPSIDRLYENDEIEDIEELIEFIYKLPLPDAVKYLICNTEQHQEKSNKNGENKNELQAFNKMLQIHKDFEPYLNHVNTFLNYYAKYPNIKIELKQKVSVNNFKKHLLNTVEHHRAFARQSALNEEWSKAIMHYEQLLDIEKKDLSALSNLVMCYDNSKKSIDDKLILRSKIEKIEPKNIDNLIAIGYLYYEKEKYEKAMHYLNSCLKINPHNIDANINRGDVKDSLEEYNEAIEDYDFAISLDPKNARAYINRGNSKDSLKKYEEAIKDYDFAASLDPNNSNIYNNRGITKNSLKKYNEAIKDFDYAISIGDKLDISYTLRACSKDYLKDYKGAIKDYEKAISLNKGYYSAYNGKANAYRKTNKIEKAHIFIDKAINLNKKDSRNYGTKAAIYSTEGNDEKFYEFLEKAFQLKAKAVWLEEDIKLKYKNKRRFQELLKKYKQTLE